MQPCVRLNLVHRVQLQIFATNPSQKTCFSMKQINVGFGQIVDLQPLRNGKDSVAAACLPALGALGLALSQELTLSTSTQNNAENM